jgi:phytoene desaturase
MRSAVIIGAGFAGLSTAAFLAKEGWSVTVLEKNATAGGRARQIKADGFSFDMGPSWYWMPDVFERFFANFGKSVSDYYQLQRLDPSYRVYWESSKTNIPAGYERLRQLFDQFEPGAARKLDKYLKEAATKYQVGMQQLVYKPGQSCLEFLDMNVIRNIFRLDILTSMKSHIKKHFKNSKLQQLMEFPILFLGALPENTPALYSLMNFADISGGTWYPNGGMHAIVQAMQNLCEELNVKFLFDEPVQEIHVENKVAQYVRTSKGKYMADVIISGADYHFTEMNLLPEKFRT